MMLITFIISQLSLTLIVIKLERSNWNIWRTILCILCLQQFIIVYRDIKEKKFKHFTHLEDGDMNIDGFLKREYLLENLPQTLIQSLVFMFQVWHGGDQLTYGFTFFNFIVSLFMCLFGFTDAFIEDFI